ncbi:multiprotein-bridging factor 1 family protein [Candidatus Woesearchaeota archaeon]|nr:multiprotein-bridging factor 1 family protein [Candidatus Woesearchaeota archaeon]
MECEMCGKVATQKAKVEGVLLEVCNGCAKFGNKVVDNNFSGKRRFYKKEEEEKGNEIIVPNYNVLIKNKREQLGLKHEDFAKKINEKESVILHIESKKFEPSLKLTRKIQKFLKIRLIEFEKEIEDVPMTKKSSGLTIGDMIKVRKSK